MAIIALRAWYIEDYRPITELEQRPPDIRLSKKSLLRSALRADFLEDSDIVRESTWFKRYLEGENIEFYIEGSGGYCVANIDLISHEIYLTKQTLLAQLEPTIFFCPQTQYPEASDALREALQTTVTDLNLRSRLPLTLTEPPRDDSPIRLSAVVTRKIRKSLLLIADTTPITTIPTEDTPQLIPSPQVCVEIGYAVQTKRADQILLAHMYRPDFQGKLPFDLHKQQVLSFKDGIEISTVISTVIQTQLARFKLFF